MTETTSRVKAGIKSRFTPIYYSLKSAQTVNNKRSVYVVRCLARNNMNTTLCTMPYESNEHIEPAEPQKALPCELCLHQALRELGWDCYRNEDDSSDVLYYQNGELIRDVMSVDPF